MRNKRRFPKQLLPLPAMMAAIIVGGVDERIEKKKEEKTLKMIIYSVFIFL